MIYEVFSMALPVSTALQGKNVDLASAMGMIGSLSEILNKMRENAQTNFQKIFLNASNFSNEIGEEIKVPRIVGIQRHRANYDQQSPEDYYRLSIFIPFLDNFITQLHDRILTHKNILSEIQNLLPVKIINLSDDQIGKTINVIMSQ